MRLLAARRQGGLKAGGGSSAAGLLAALLVLFVGAPPRAAGGAPPRLLALSEGWLFQPDPLGVGDAQGWWRRDLDRRGWRPVTVPMAWDRYDPSMDGYEGVGWYALELPAASIVPGAWQRLRFGRANHSATVWINGSKAGGNLTGYMPFEIAITPWVVPGEPVRVVVRVENGARYDWLPGTTTVEWVQYGGLLEPVELLTSPPAHLAHMSLWATPHGSDARLQADIQVENRSSLPFTGRVRFETGNESVEASVRLEPGADRLVHVELALANLRLWSPDDPALYDASAILLDGSAETDRLADRFGVRSIGTSGRRILLNGRPLRIRGVNRYDEFPGAGPVVDDQTIRADLLAVKAAGANLVRVHYPQSPAHLRIADEIGLLFMEEVPLNWWRAPWHPPVPPEADNDRIIDLAEKTLGAMVERDGNHPSLVIWSMANECQTADDRGVRAMERLLLRAKTLDPTRLATYVANGRFEKNLAFASADLVAVNLYYGMWDGPVARDLSEIDGRVYRPTREALREVAALFPDKPILLAEFGTIGIPGSGGDVRFSEDYQAAYLAAVWRAVEAVPEVSGGAVWSWADYRHRRGFTNDFPAYFGPFGMLTIDRHPKQSLGVMRRLWAASGRDGGGG